MKMGKATVLVTLCSLVIGAMNAAADEFTWQGQINDGGSPAEGVYDLKFRLYDIDTAGTPLGLGELAAVDVLIEGGAMSIKLDFGTDTFDGNDRWLEVDIKADADVSYTTLTPRQKVDPTPYAHHSKKADVAKQVDDGGLPATYSGSIQFTNPGNTFAGNGSGLTKLDASELVTGIIPNPRLGPDVVRTIGATFTGPVIFSGGMSGDGSGLSNLNASALQSGNMDAARLPTGGSWGLSSALDVDNETLFIDPSLNSVGIGKPATSSNYKLDVVTNGTVAMRATSGAIDGIGVYGHATASTPGFQTYGVWGQNEHTSGAGVFGHANNGATGVSGVGGVGVAATGQIGLLATAWNNPTAYAAQFEGRVYFDSAVGIGTTTPDDPLDVITSSSRAIHAVSSGSGGDGVFGESSSSSGRGIHGHATALSGSATGVQGVSDSIDGRGVYGLASAAGGANYGVRGVSLSPSGTGVAGISSVGIGQGIGVYGTAASPDGYAGYFTGRSYFGGLVGFGTTNPFYPVHVDTNNSRGVHVSTSSTSSAAAAVAGIATSTTGATSGGYFGSASTSGTGVFGLASSTTGTNYGVYGQTNSSSGFAGYFTGSGTGVYGLANSASGTNYGVYGDTNSPSGYAGYFTGGKNYFEGSVGIGTTSPSVPLHVVSNSEPSLAVEAASTAGQSTALSLRGARSGYTTANTAYLDLRNFDEDEGVDGTDYPMARIGAGMADVAGQTGFLRFQVADGTGLQECMRIDKIGNVGMGTINPLSDLHIVHTNGTLGEQGLTIQNGSRWTIYNANNDDLWLIHNDTQRGQFNWVTGTYSAVSDERLKKNVEPLDSTLDRLMQLQPRTYHFNEEQDDAPRHIGLIAQELKEHFPEVVSIQDGDEGGAIEDLHTVAYSELVPVLIKAVQEQQAIIDRLKADHQIQVDDLLERIESNERRNSDLEARLLQLENMARRN